MKKQATRIWEIYKKTPDREKYATLDLLFGVNRGCTSEVFFFELAAEELPHDEFLELTMEWAENKALCTLLKKGCLSQSDVSMILKKKAVDFEFKREVISRKMVSSGEAVRIMRREPDGVVSFWGLILRKRYLDRRTVIETIRSTPDGHLRLGWGDTSNQITSVTERMWFEALKGGYLSKKLILDVCKKYQKERIWLAAIKSGRFSQKELLEIPDMVEYWSSVEGLAPKIDMETIDRAIAQQLDKIM